MFRKVVFGLACGCTILSGQGEEPPQKNWFPPQQEVGIAVSTTASGSVSAAFPYIVRRGTSTDSS